MQKHSNSLVSKTFKHPAYGKSFPFRYLLIFSLIITLFSAKTAEGQRSEIGFLFGGSYYIGDLNPSRQFAMTRMAAGGLYRFNINENLALRVNGIWGNVAGDDDIVQYNTNRNLHFRSNIFELSLQGEVNFLMFTPGDLDTPSTPYIFAGGGIFRFNPQAEIDGTWYNLRPLRTEGQESPYSTTSHNFLFGIGYKFNITRQFTGAFEWGLRRTGTDYLDDISTTYPDAAVFEGNPIALELYDRSLENRGQNAGFQRGNPNVNDWYAFAGITLTIRIKDLNLQRCPAYN